MDDATMTTPPLKDANEPTEPEIPKELAEYAKVIRESVETGDCELFRNSSPAHAAVLMQLFCEAAQRYAYIFCGHLNAEVFGNLWPVIEKALGRGVDVRVLTESAEVEAKELARELSARERLRTVYRRVELPEGMPHYAVFDDKMSRLETDREQRTAVVRTNVATDDVVGRERLAQMYKVFNSLWKKATPVAG